MKTATWSLQDAKNRLSEVVERARTEGEQVITKHGKPVVVVVSVERMKRIKRGSSLLGHLRKCPAPGLGELVGARSRETSRTIKLG